jgi:hypothetical protein
VVPTCWDCYIGEWSLHVGIVSLLRCWYCYTDVLYIGIASLVSGHICWHCYTGEWSYMLALLHWYVVIYVGIAILVSGPICCHCYTGK